jgi:lysophospholipase L1-like esterase
LLSSIGAPSAPGDQASATQRSEDERLRNDWAYLERYRAENARLGPPADGERRVVFMGDSITEGWGALDHRFPGFRAVNRGISGQTTPQMLVRFRPDVVRLRPAAVVLLAGINDLAGNTGPIPLEETEGNIASMAELAAANGIRVVLSSVLPAKAFPWRPGVNPVRQIIALNAWIRSYAALHRHVYLDYYSAMVDPEGGLRRELSADGVHPNTDGYAVMQPAAQSAVRAALRRRQAE